jgi:hypothetical protein
MVYHLHYTTRCIGPNEWSLEAHGKNTLLVPQNCQNCNLAQGGAYAHNWRTMGTLYVHPADPSNTSFKNHLFTPAPRCVKPVLDLNFRLGHRALMQSLMSDCVYYDGELWLSLVRVKIDKQYLSSCAARLATCFSRAIINADDDWRITNTSMTLVPLQLVGTSNGSPIFYVDHEESS